ncbi:MAG TPA: CmcI family methyltransferase, partial [Candidatus Paceibacterota bacterium]
MQIDTGRKVIVLDDGKEVPLYSKEGFRLLSQVWLTVGWDQKYLYGFTWFGRPIIQIPDDMVRLQEVIYQLKPDVVIETGIAHGGGLIFYASLLKAMDKGKVVGVDIEIRDHNRKAIESHELFPLITLIEADSVAPSTLEAMKQHVPSGGTSLVILDSDHTYAHVLKELRAYAPLVSVGSYIIATDGSMEFLTDSPRAQKQYP